MKWFAEKNITIAIKLYFTYCNPRRVIKLAARRLQVEHGMNIQGASRENQEYYANSKIVVVFHYMHWKPRLHEGQLCTEGRRVSDVMLW